jgi:hypothetical protein
MRAHLEDILLIAHSHIKGFNLFDTNNATTDQYYFKMVTHLSVYLHRQDPQAGILYAYLNPILIDIIHTAFYKCHNHLHIKYMNSLTNIPT